MRDQFDFQNTEDTRFRVALRRIEIAILRSLRRTIKGNAPCDSKPKLCVRCKSLRFYLRKRKMPNFMIINTKHGLFVWNNTNAKVYAMVRN